jgi:hypothetical protein
MHTEYGRPRNRFGPTSDWPQAGSLPIRMGGPALVPLLLLIVTITACGGSHPSGNPREKVLVEILVSASSTPSVKVASTIQLSASGGYGSSPGDISYTDVTNSATWTTSNSAVASVNKGLVTGTGIGSVTISAAFGGKTGSTTVFVGLTHYITISPAGPFSLSATPSTTFYATENFSDGTTLDVSGPATWTAKPAGIIDIYPFLGGDATLVAPGTTTVTATLDSGESGSVEVTVVP